MAIFTLRNVVLCSGPPSVYRIKTGGTFSLVPYFSIKTLAISLAFQSAEDGSVAVIFRETIGFPRYEEPSTSSGISFKSITVGIKETVEKS